MWPFKFFERICYDGDSGGGSADNGVDGASNPGQDTTGGIGAGSAEATGSASNSEGAGSDPGTGAGVGVDASTSPADAEVGSVESAAPAAAPTSNATTSAPASSSAPSVAPQGFATVAGVTPQSLTDALTEEEAMTQQISETVATQAIGVPGVQTAQAAPAPIGDPALGTVTVDTVAGQMTMGGYATTGVNVDPGTSVAPSKDGYFGGVEATAPNTPGTGTPAAVDNAQTTPAPANSPNAVDTITNEGTTAPANTPTSTPAPSVAPPAEKQGSGTPAASPGFSNVAAASAPSTGGISMGDVFGALFGISSAAAATSTPAPPPLPSFGGGQSQSSVADDESATPSVRQGFSNPAPLDIPTPPPLPPLSAVSTPAAPPAPMAPAKSFSQVAPPTPPAPAAPPQRGTSSKAATSAPSSAPVAPRGLTPPNPSFPAWVGKSLTPEETLAIEQSPSKGAMPAYSTPLGVLGVLGVPGTPGPTAPAASTGLPSLPSSPGVQPGVAPTSTIPSLPTTPSATTNQEASPEASPVTSAPSKQGFTAQLNAASKSMSLSSAMQAVQALRASAQATINDPTSTEADVAAAKGYLGKTDHIANPQIDPLQASQTTAPSVVGRSQVQGMAHAVNNPESLAARAGFAGVGTVFSGATMNPATGATSVDALGTGLRGMGVAVPGMGMVGQLAGKMGVTAPISGANAFSSAPSSAPPAGSPGAVAGSPNGDTDDERGFDANLPRAQPTNAVARLAEAMGPEIFAAGGPEEGFSTLLPEYRLPFSAPGSTDEWSSDQPSATKGFKAVVQLGRA